ncbi:dTDP-4-dehydrorhamnose 3,5-epimerase family protein [Brevundimonas lenta]|uniref:dTDP-4-dehydrorhamnose 3,5-epimerase n=1 Tax=Brevundimonas lenta TaxID=424796 RepID=A0A7W6JFG0_9CAUL|nr:dTDP-4-dehydrorhamnose 3,5-epimerase family protein [Brevundimonas lenta]MBB4084111.1 dTDP-4-dehydrorhamnose 3,5-epimerase [Brevundimonas lenta]
MDPFVRLDQTTVRREDNRGWLEVLYESDAMVLKRSFSKAGVFRGLHVQRAPSAQTKVIRVVEGSIVDVLVSIEDPSRELKTATLTPADGWVRIDSQYAHGFYALQDTVFEYVCDGGYDEASEEAYSIADRLPALLGVETVILSDKDRAAPPLTAAGAE